MSIDVTRLARKNHLLNALPQEALQRIQPDLTQRSLELRDCVAPLGKPTTTVFFPIDCVLSTITSQSGGWRAGF